MCIIYSTGWRHTIIKWFAKKWTEFTVFSVVSIDAHANRAQLISDRNNARRPTCCPFKWRKCRIENSANK